jgi:hypothetical protein
MAMHFTYIIFTDGPIFSFGACYYVNLDRNEKINN